MRTFFIKADSSVPPRNNSGNVVLTVRPIRAVTALPQEGDTALIWLNEQGFIARASIVSATSRNREWEIEVESVEDFGSPYLTFGGRKENRKLRRGPREIDAFGYLLKVHKDRRDRVDELKAPDLSDIERALQDISGPPSFFDATNEVARLRQLGTLASRPKQREFSSSIRKSYSRRCALTGCSTPEALQAAHVRVEKNLDDNSIENGILLRADIHALFDAGLITLSLSGESVELSPKLQDSSYQFLTKAKVTRPMNGAPSFANIAHHRRRFGFS